MSMDITSSHRRRIEQSQTTYPAGSPRARLFHGRGWRFVIQILQQRAIVKARLLGLEHNVALQGREETLLRLLDHRAHTFTDAEAKDYRRVIAWMAREFRRDARGV